MFEQIMNRFLDGSGCGVGIVGEMFANKTGTMFNIYQEMLKWSRISAKKYGGLVYLFFKPKGDERYGNHGSITNHDLTISLVAIEIDISRPQEILEKVSSIIQKGKKIGGIFIDEAWCFDRKILEIYNELRSRNLIVVLTLLNRYYNGDPVTLSGELLTMCTITITQHAICIPCAEKGKNSSRSEFSFRIDQIWKNFPNKRPTPISNAKVDFGGGQKYFAACWKCFEKINKMIKAGMQPDLIIDEMRLREHLVSHGAL